MTPHAPTAERATPARSGRAVRPRGGRDHQRESSRHRGIRRPTREIEREFLLAFWKLHILHHAGEEPVVGQWIMRELRRHGYEVSPGTLYPLLARMERRGWLRSKADPHGGRRARKEYRLTREGASVLGLLRRQVEELHREVVLGEEEDAPTAARVARRGRGGRGRRR